MAKTVKVPCPDCSGPGSICITCIGRGKVQGFCVWCNMPGEVLSGETPLCLACAAPCALCGHRIATDDGVPFDGVGFAHSRCVLSYALGEFLEDQQGPVESERAQMNVHAGVRTCERMEVNSMPRARSTLVERMRAAGFITVVAASKRCGFSHTTIYKWISKELVRARHSGTFTFISVASLDAYAPPLDELVPTPAERKEAAQ